MKRLLSVFSALVFSSVVAWGANLSLQSGAVDPSNIRGTINTLIRSINSGVGGLINAQTGTTFNSTTVEQTLASYTLPGTTLATAGQAIRVSCWGDSAANTNGKTVKLYFGSESVGITGFATSGQDWYLTLTVMRTDSTTISYWGQTVTTVIAVTAATASETLGSSVLIKCTGTASANNDLFSEGMITELVK